jgi:hypothetical protein
MRLLGRSVFFFVICTWHAQYGRAFVPRRQFVRTPISTNASFSSKMPLPPPPPVPDQTDLFDALAQKVSKALESFSPLDTMSSIQGRLLALRDQLFSNLSQLPTLDSDMSSIQEQILAIKMQLIEADAKVLHELETSSIQGRLLALRDQLFSNLSQLPTLESDMSSIQEQILALKIQLLEADAKVLHELGTIASSFQTRLLEDFPQLAPILRTLSSKLEPIFESPILSLSISAVLIYTTANYILTAGQGPPPSRPYPNQRYDPATAKEYFDRRLPTIVARALYVMVQSTRFGLSLLGDKVKYVLDGATLPLLFVNVPQLTFLPLFYTTATKSRKTSTSEAASWLHS